MSDFLIRIILFSCCIGSLMPAGAQSYKAFEKAGDKAAAQQDLNAALQHYLSALEIRPEAGGIHFKCAHIARQFHAYELAAHHYHQVLKFGQPMLQSTVNYHLGMVYKAMGRYTEALTYFSASLQDEGSLFRDEAAKQLDECAWASALVEATPSSRVVRLGKQINSPYTEFAPLSWNDTLYFSSMRFDNPMDKHEPPRLISKVLHSIRGSAARPLRDAFNLDKLHTAHTTISARTRRIYFTRCTYINASAIRCELFYKAPDKRGRYKAEAIRLPSTINQPGYTSTHPSIGFDSVQQQEYLYFVSDRPGGRGGLDIWKVRTELNGSWGLPEAQSDINTPADDITPFFHEPSQTLYFSTNGRASLGGFDLYRMALPAGQASPEHLGYPLNSSYNDLYPFVMPDGRSGYFSSNRTGSMYLDPANKTCCNDIWSFSFLEQNTPEDSVSTDSTLEFTVLDDPAPPAERIPETLEDFLPLALYFDNDEPDKRTRRSSTQKSYDETYRAYIAQRPAYLKAYAAPAGIQEKDEALDRMDQFFDEEIARGMEHLELFSILLLGRLQAGDTLEIFIKGFTSPRAQSDYNLALGARRVSSVRNFFSRWRSGVFSPYLLNGQLTLSERSFGESSASKAVSDQLDDLRGSIFSIGAMRERRVEIVEVK
jgi:tetratricopeptide (TPR) repeat protein